MAPMVVDSAGFNNSGPLRNPGFKDLVIQESPGKELASNVSDDTTGG